MACSKKIRSDDRHPGAYPLLDRNGRAHVTAFEFAKARLTGEEPKLGENRKVTVTM
jgi:hypothetical protein